MWAVLTVTLVASLVLTPLARRLTMRFGAVDHPDGKRKLQELPVPLWGGLAVYLSLLLGLWVARQMATGGQQLDSLASELMAAAGLVCLAGCIDDSWDLNPRFKLLMQTVATLPIVLAGHAIDRIVLFGSPIELGWLGIPLTVCWLLGCINALNLLDGLDGLASTVGLAAVAVIAVIATSMGHDHVAMIAIALAGALAGFLVYNLPPASIYLGDSGSMVIGLVVGVLGIQSSLKTTTTLAITAPAVIMAIPMLDTVLAIVRRKLTGRRFDAADRGHIHHRLLERGLTTWQVLSVIGALCLATGAAATASTFLRNDAVAWIATFAIVALLIKLRAFGHHEVALIKVAATAWLTRISQRWVHSSAARQRQLQQQSGLSFEAAWQALTLESQLWHTHRLEVSVGSRQYTEQSHVWDREPFDDQAQQWSLSLAFRDQNDRFCELKAVGTEPPTPQPWHLLRVATLLEAFGQQWVSSAEHGPAMVIPFSQNAEWEDIPQSRAA